MFPLGTVLLPGEALPLRIFEPRYRQMLSDCLGERDPHDLDPTDPARFGVVLIARGSEVGGGDTRHDVGTFASIDTVLRESDGRAVLNAIGSGRFRIAEWLPDAPYPRAAVTELLSPPVNADHRRSLATIEAGIRDLLRGPATRQGIPLSHMPAFDDDTSARVLDSRHGVLGWAANLPFGPADRQRLLDASDTDAQIAVIDDAVDGLRAMLTFGE